MVWSQTYIHTWWNMHTHGFVEVTSSLCLEKVVNLRGGMTWKEPQRGKGARNDTSIILVYGSLENLS